MADLTIAPASGDQGTTQNPQTVPSGQAVGGASKQSGSVQPGTSNTLLTGTSGVNLEPSTLTTVSLAPGATTQSQTTKPVAEAQQPAHHANAALFGICIALVLVAAGLFWFIKNSAKSTTNY